jgi:hypothetical protein
LDLNLAEIEGGSIATGAACDAPPLPWPSRVPAHPHIARPATIERIVRMAMLWQGQANHRSSGRLG